MSKLLSNEEFIIKAKIIHGNKYDYSKVIYTNAHNKVIIICKIHGEFIQKPYSHSNGSGCKICGNKKEKGVTKISNTKFISKAEAIHGNKYDYSKTVYKNNKDKVIIICKIHGEFLQQPSNHLMGAACNKCGHKSCGLKTSLNINKFIEKANQKHNNYYEYSLVNYINNKTKIKIICPKHGVFNQRPSDHLSGYGCSCCSQSKGEKKITFILTNENINFISQHKFNDCRYKRELPFDFYLPEYNTCVEYHGEQHYEVIKHWGGEMGLKNQIKRDNIKKNYCKDKNIKLLIIKYNESINEKLKIFIQKNMEILK